MIGKFLQWIGMDRSRTSGPSSDRPTGNTHRRLAIEPIEDRLLLSATGAESVADGGAVSVVPFSDWNLAAGLGHESSGVFISIDDSSANAFDSGGRLAGTLQHGETWGGTDYHSVLNSSVASGLEGSESQELAPDDLAPPENGAGLVNVTRMAHQEVFAEIGTSDSMLDELPGFQPQLKLAADDLSAARLSVNSAPSHNPSEPLTGSRGRLAAFDLAMREETFDWRAGTNAAEPTNARHKLPAPAAEARSPRPDSVTLPALSNVRREMGDARFVPSIDASPLAQSNSVAVQNEPDADETTSVHAAYLDQRREKPVAHLAIVLGVGQAVMGQRRQGDEDDDQEQRPPRKR